MAQVYIEEPPVSRFLFANTNMAWFWFVVRVYVGYAWIIPGWGKVNDAAWVGANAGQKLSGFIQGALGKTEVALTEAAKLAGKTGGVHADVASWYAWFLEKVVLPNASTWAHVVAWGELLVGVALILGALTGIAAFFGLFMNLNFLLAGTVSVNPILFVLSLGLVLAWRVAGSIGLDRYLLPLFGVPWKPGKIFKK